MTAKFSLHSNAVRLIAIIVLGIAVVVTGIFLLSNKEKTHHPDFISQNLSQADSLIKTMSLDEKISRLLVVEAKNDKDADLLLKATSHTPAAIIFAMDSSKNYPSIVQRKESLTLPPLFIIPEKNHFHPEFYREYNDHPNKTQILAVSDSTVLNTILDFEVKINQLLKTDVWLMNEPLSTEKKHKVYQKLHNANIMTSAFLEYDILKNNNLPLTPHFLFIRQDTLTADKEGNMLFYSELIRKKSGFNGLLIADFPEEDIGETFCNSASDMFFVKSNYFKTAKKIKTLIKNKDIPEKVLDQKLRRVLSVLLLKAQQSKENTLYSESNTTLEITKHDYLFNLVRQKSMILLSNPNNIIPFKTIPAQLTIYFNGDKRNAFIRNVKHYTTVEDIDCNLDNISKNHPHDSKQLLVINKHGQTSEETETLLMHLDSLKTARKIIAILFDDNFYTGRIPKNLALVQIAGKTATDMEYAAQALFGGQEISGQITGNSHSSEYQYTQSSKTRIGYTRPERLGLDTSILYRIDSIVEDAINKSCFPGCQVYFSYKGNVILNNSYGYHTYKKQRKVKNTHVYDLASITKVAATTLTVMQTIDKKKLNLNKKIGAYFQDTIIHYTRIEPDTIIRIDTLSLKQLTETYRNIQKQDTVSLNDSLFVLTDTIIYKVTPESNIFQCTVFDMLIHKSGLPPSLPILRLLNYQNDTILPLPAEFILNQDNTLTFTNLKNKKDSLKYLFFKYYNQEKINTISNYKIATKMYLRNAYRDTLWNDIKQTRVYSKDVYMYSDLNAVMVQAVLDSINDKPLAHYVYKNFYKPMGLKRTFFNPLYFLNKSEIVPTAYDRFWRNQIIHGCVHDPSAALLGGVGGNAGLFSNAEDLGLLFQMLLQNGHYGGSQYIKPQTIKHFISRQNRSHRGLGFDLASSRNICAKDAPITTFGHTGFTGTCVWADPENEIVFVFLSNRTYPSSRNWKINKYKIRQKIHQLIYDALPEKNNKLPSLNEKENLSFKY
ncbi:MAG: serine hydrolase [Bacteroidales bacterium]